MNRELKIEPEDKLHWLRRVDHQHEWAFLDEERYCLRCRRTFTGRQVRLIGGTRPHGPLRFCCPTAGCSSTPDEWTSPREKLQRSHHSDKNLPSSNAFGLANRINVQVRLPINLTEWEERHPRLRHVVHFLHHYGVPV